MILKKYIHSCILIESKGKRLLIDPGIFSFADGILKPKDIGHVDAILITHSHPDHFSIDALKQLVSKSTEIFTNQEVAGLLEREEIPCEVVRINNTKEVAGFKIRALEAQHGDLPVPKPLNTAFMIDDKVLHPGDSLDVLRLEGAEVVLLPVTAPWSRLVDAIDFAKRFKPRLVVPIHDYIIKDVMLARVYEMCRAGFSDSGVEFKPLNLWEELPI